MILDQLIQIKLVKKSGKQRIERNGGKMAGVSKMVALFIAILSIGLPHTVNAAKTLEQSLEIPLDDHSLVLPMGPVFNQGRTLWCWAYAALHTLRTYYQKHDPMQENWGAVIASLNGNASLRSYLKDKVATKERHYPGYFLKLLADDFDLSRAGWQMYFRKPLCRPNMPTEGGEGITLDSGLVHDVITSSLRRGAPTVYCNGVHCVTIFGVDFANGAPVRYRIADSISGIGARDASAIERDFCTLTTLVK